jgi:tRNA dimethylallyltransferase
VADELPIVLILGPTAAGKTDLAVELATSLPGAPVGGECICADSMQVYRGMDIGTAKPTAGQRAAVPHHLLDLLDPREEGFSVDTWLDLARRAVAEVRGRSRHPIVVGGTNLYVQALLEGLQEGPPPDWKPPAPPRFAGAWKRSTPSRPSASTPTIASAQSGRSRSTS